jgi:predicted permease
VLVAGQVAIASLILVAAGLLTRSLFNAVNDDPGFTTRRAVLMSVEVPSTLSREQTRAYHELLVATVNGVPGVEQASLARVVPVAGGSRRLFSVPGYVPRPGEDMELHVNTIHRDYFATMGFAPVSGRTFQSSDTGEPPVIVVNDVLANRYFAGDAVGRHMRSGKTTFEIIGVVKAERRTDRLSDPPTPVVFYQLERDVLSQVTLVARTSSDPVQLAETIRRAAIGLNRDAAVFGATTLEALMTQRQGAKRLTASLVGTCGALALVLAIVGVYGTVAYAVVRRTREIGLRMALGAQPAQILGLFMREGGRVIAMGVGLGVLAALGITQLLRSMLFGISATDPATFILMPMLVIVTALVASGLPAIRALRISPTAALRHE